MDGNSENKEQRDADRLKRKMKWFDELRNASLVSVNADRSSKYGLLIGDEVYVLPDMPIEWLVEYLRTGGKGD